MSNNIEHAGSSGPSNLLLMLERHYWDCAVDIIGLHVVLTHISTLDERHIELQDAAKEAAPKQIKDAWDRGEIWGWDIVRDCWVRVC